MTEVIMPKMGDGMEEGTLLEWLKKDGELVKSGEIIGTIQTDKATLELESPGKGILTGFLIQPGETVPVGVPIAAILRDGESLPANWGSGAAAAPASADAPAADAPVAQAAPAGSAAPSADLGRVKASPLAKKVAAEAGVDLSLVVGSGPGGRITEKDVRKAIAEQGTPMPKQAAPTFTAPAITATAEDTKVALTPLRRISGQRTLQSKLEAPHFYVTVEVDLEKISALRAAFKAEESGAISVNDFVVAACVKALQDMPSVNATFMGDHILQHGAINIGVAAAVEQGLLVPVLHNAHAMTLRQMSAGVKELVVKAKDGKLTPNEMSGSTFSISNMGMLGVENFAAIINGPNSAILAVSTAKKTVVVTADDELEVRTMMKMTASFDHRVIDGAEGAKFINIVKSYLENPTRLLS